MSIKFDDALVSALVVGLLVALFKMTACAEYTACVKYADDAEVCQ